MQPAVNCARFVVSCLRRVVRWRVTRCPMWWCCFPGSPAARSSNAGKWSGAFGRHHRQGAVTLGGSMERTLALPDDDPSRTISDDGIVADALIPDLHLIPGLLEDRRLHGIANDLRRDFDVRAGRELLPVSLRLAPRQPRRGAQARDGGDSLADGMAAIERQRRREAHPDRALDGRAGRAVTSSNASRDGRTPRRSSPSARPTAARSTPSTCSPTG